MEINLTNRMNTDFGIGRDSLSATAVNAGREAQEASRASRPTSGIDMPARADGLAAAEPVMDIPDAAIVRDDALGKFVNSVFNLPPPPMPPEIANG